jgi:RNA polymerase sigma factor (sigma-70 family)
VASLASPTASPHIAVRFGGRAGTIDWMTDDAQLLRQFTDEGSQAALAELVRRRIDFVYATALRQVGGDAHLAQDVTQSVFLALARSARSLARRQVLTGWLYTTTRFLAAKAVRAHRRWRVREQESHAMNEISRQGAPEPEWDRLRPVLDEAMHELSERDREAILLRYFEGRAFAEVGAACGVNENSARMRVERALEKLRRRLARRGITSTAAALGAALAAQPVVTAPVGLAAAVSGAAVAGLAAGGGALGVLAFMSMTKLKIGAVCALVALLGAGGYVANRIRVETANELATPADTSARQSPEIARLRAENRRLSREAEGLGTEQIVHSEENKPVAAATQSKMPAGESTDVQRRRILTNLRMIGAARAMFTRLQGHAPVSLAAMSRLLPELAAVDGEAYDRLDFMHGREFSVTTRSGLCVTLDVSTTGIGTPIPIAGRSRNVPDGLTPKVFKALSAWQAARGDGSGSMPRSAEELVPYFATASDGADYWEWLETIGWPQR